MKVKNKIVKFICCFNVTLGARLIGFVGIALSAGLASVLLRDTSENDYNASRRMALIFGLDWQHFHPSANVTQEADPDGQMISIIVVFYSLLYLATSLCLIFATIIKSRWLVLPWLSCESFGCLSKLVAIIFHNIYNTQQYNSSFVTSSVIYIVLMTWWWLVVFLAQMTWKKDVVKPFSRISLTSYVKADSSPLEPPSQVELNKTVIKWSRQDSLMDSPGTYTVNERYARI